MLILRNLSLGAGLLLLLAGFVFVTPWTASQSEYSIWLLRGLLMALALALLGGRLGRLPVTAILGLLGLGALLHFHGLAAVAACTLFLIAALGVGSTLCDDSRDSPWLALPLGAALISGAAAWLLFLPIFSPAAIGGVLLLLIALLHRRIRRQAGLMSEAVAAAYRQSPRWSAVVALALLAALVPAWLPVMAPDDLASHLQLGWQLQTLGYYRMDVGSQVWSLAPWLADVSYGLLQALARNEVVGVLNSAWLLITLWLIVRIGQELGLGRGLAWLAALMYASIPLTSALTMSMQTETATAAAVAALALLILKAPAIPDRRTLLAAAVLAAYLLGMKVVNLTVIGPLGLLLLWRWRGAVPWRALPAALALALLVGGASYLYAWLLTGNPVAPLFNGFFQSSWFPTENATDTRWLKGLSWQTPFWLTFRSGDYYEGAPGVAGFTLLFLAAAAIPAALDARLRPLLLVALLAWLLPLTQLQYLRYTQPALVLLLPVLLAGMATAGNKRLLLGAGSLLVALQLVFLTSASWMLGSGVLRILLRDGSEAVITTFAPERVIAQQLRERMRADDRVLIASHDFAALAEFAGSAFVTNWYDSELRQLQSGTGDGMERWQAVFERTGANLLLVRRDPLDPALQRWMEARKAQLVTTINDASLYRIERQPESGRPLDTAAGAVSIRFEAPEQAQARLAAFEVQLECSRPFEPLATGWALQRRDGTVAWRRHRWISCPANGKAKIELGMSLPSEWGDMVFEALPVSVESQQTLDLLDQAQRNRRDLAAERNLSGDIRKIICRRWQMCREIVRPMVLHSTD